MNIDSIKNGIVIDHITAGKGMEIYRLLGLEELDCSVALIKNVASKKSGKKDIIKIDSDFDVDTDILGFVDPDVTVNIIKNGQIAEKKTIELPQELTNVLKCKIRAAYRRSSRSCRTFSALPIRSTAFTAAFTAKRGQNNRIMSKRRA